MFDFVFEIIIEFIGVLAWYIPLYILFSFIGGFFKIGVK